MKRRDKRQSFMVHFRIQGDPFGDPKKFDPKWSLFGLFRNNKNRGKMEKIKGKRKGLKEEGQKRGQKRGRLSKRKQFGNLATPK